MISISPSFNLIKMKSTFVLSLLIIAVYVVSSGFQLEPPIDELYKFKMNKKVTAIVMEKCYGCHSPNGKNEKPKKAFNWDTLAELSPADFSSKMAALKNVLDEGVMPPSRMLERMPDKKLTEKETKILLKWAKKQSRKNKI